jgi:hypothetical protein
MSLALSSMALSELPLELLQRILYDVPVFDLIELSHHFSLFRCHCEDRRFWRDRAQYRYHDTHYMYDTSRIPVVNYLETISYHGQDLGQAEISEIRASIGQCLAKLEAWENSTNPKVHQYKVSYGYDLLLHPAMPWMHRMPGGTDLMIDAHGQFGAFRKIHRLIIDSSPSVTDAPLDLLDQGIRDELRWSHEYRSLDELTVKEFIVRIVVKCFHGFIIGWPVTLTECPK